jgi:beta-carotene 3-hydroxylase
MSAEATQMLAGIALLAATFVAMEIAAALTHRYVMHGPLWCWHRSHHEPRRGLLERNDLFAVLFALPSIALVYAALHGQAWLLPVALGTVAYGVVYVVFHDGLVHRRVPMPRPAGRYLRRIVQAHHLHHAVRTREGALSFGFLHAPDPRALRRELRRRRAAERHASREGSDGAGLRDPLEHERACRP